MQNARQQKGYLESLIRIGDSYNNEAYTHRSAIAVGLPFFHSETRNSRPVAPKQPFSLGDRAPDAHLADTVESVPVPSILLTTSVFKK